MQREKKDECDCELEGQHSEAAGPVCTHSSTDEQYKTASKTSKMKRDSLPYLRTSVALSMSALSCEDIEGRSFNRSSMLIHRRRATASGNLEGTEKKIKRINAREREKHRYQKATFPLKANWFIVLRAPIRAKKIGNSCSTGYSVKKQASRVTCIAHHTQRSAKALTSCETSLINVPKATCTKETIWENNALER